MALCEKTYMPYVLNTYWFSLFSPSMKPTTSRDKIRRILLPTLGLMAMLALVGLYLYLFTDEPVAWPSLSEAGTRSVLQASCPEGVTAETRAAESSV